MGFESTREDRGVRNDRSAWICRALEYILGSTGPAGTAATDHHLPFVIVLMEESL